MIKNNRLYTNESGCIDDGLITDKSADAIEAVSSWIRENIRPARKILQGRTSYGLKHALEHDTGVYLTNNEFKDALFLAGFKPVREDELNWRYRIVLVKELGYNPSPFFQWTAKNYGGVDSPLGDFAEDMVHDKEFTILAEKGIIRRYLHRIGACRGAMEAFDELWRAYARKTH